ncbi:MAG: helicase-exonuclease AddAB subunit AddA [Ruminococcaceae bacterium]|nr:helicase-exonuclease AddAB subunit AddA [Oscillospiraceae bacterium]
MAEKLTPQQQQAVDDRGGMLLVSAAAGSGKTKVLVDRLMKYIMDPHSPCSIDDFLMITYTKAAAAELRGKIAAKLSEHLAADPDNRHLQRQMQRLYLAKISTVHSFCTDLLRQHAHELDLAADFRVGDENECRQLREQVMNELLDEAYASWMEDADFRAFVDTQGLGRDDRLVPEIVQKVYDSARCHLDPEKWLEHCVTSSDLSETTDAAQTVWGGYLLEDLHRYLDMQISAMRGCLALAEEEETLAKPAALLQQTLVALEFLNEATTWDQVVARRSIDYGRLTFSKKVPDQELCDRIKAVRNGCKDGLAKKLKIFCDPSEAVLADLGQTAGAVRGLVKLARAFGDRYTRLKQRRRVLDFSDLEHRSLDLLLGKSRSAPTAVAREEGRHFREVLVDEYQDSNAVQDAIFGSLTREKGNCFMVGDVKQSIYRFRLADPGIFLEKYGTYVPAEEAQEGQGRKILLSRNFRSGGAVLEATNDVFYRCMSESVGDLNYTEDEALVEGIPHEPLGEPEVELHVLKTTDDTYNQEAAFVADRIAELLNGTHMIRGKDGLRPIEAEDIAILLRSPGSVGQCYQDALSARGIRSSFGSGRDLLQTGEIGVLRSLLQILSNPRQDIPLIAVLCSPVFGFTADDLARIRSRQKHGDFYDALLLDDSAKTLSFLEILELLRRCARQLPLARLLEEIFCITRMDSIYAAMDSGVERTANLREFYRLALDFESASRRDLSQFLEHLQLLEEKGLTIQETPTGGAVQILSIHKSKGLEYPVVFLSGLSRGFNKEDLRAQVLCEKELGLGLSAVDRENRVRYPTIAKRAIVARTARESLSEELRVLYVGMTRARDRLIMTYAEKKPEATLADIAQRIDLGGTELLSSEVSSPGQWVLMEAMCRTEAGALFSMAGARPAQTHLSDHPWRIAAFDCPDAVAAAGEEETKTMSMPEGTVEKLHRQLTFRYLHEAATVAPSKQTATQLKGRDKDEEIKDNAAPEPRQRTWRSFGDRSARRGMEYGVAMHTVMQYVRFDACATRAGLEGELQRLTKARIIPAELAPKLNRNAILAFFETDIGRKLMTQQHIREFKFSILEDAGIYGEELRGEQILLQGVVDCALVEDDGITVVDFKTDYVTDETLSEVLARYRPQVDTYSRALERIYETPVKGTYLYFFHLRKLIAV